MAFPESPDPITVLIPGAAGAAGIDAIRRLRKSDLNVRIIATDRDPLAAGSAMADAFLQTGQLHDPGEFARILDHIRREGVRLVLPTGASDSLVYSQNAIKLERAGAQFVGSGWETASLCNDKQRFGERISPRFPAPRPIEIADDGPLTYPCFVKSRFGAGGFRGLCQNRNDWRRFESEARDNLVAQEYLPGTEISVDLLSDMTARPLCAVPRTRISVLDGVAVRTRVFRDAAIQHLCMDLARFLKLKGPSCMQLKQDANQVFKFQEVNARIGGCTIASALAGIDIVNLSVRMALGQAFEIPDFEEVLVCRYFAETVV